MFAGNHWQNYQSRRWERNEGPMQFSSWEKIHKQFEVATSKDVVNVRLLETILKLTLKRFFHRPSHPSEAWKLSNTNRFAKSRAFILNILELIGILLCPAFFIHLYIAESKLETCNFIRDDLLLRFKPTTLLEVKVCNFITV